MGATNTAYFCLNTQQALDSALSMGNHPKFGVQETLGATRAVRSAENLQGFEFIESSSRARNSSTSNRKVTIYGNPKTCSSVSTGGYTLCGTATAETTDFVDTELQVNNSRHITRTYDRTVYRDTCDTADGRAASKIAENLIWDAYQILKQENEDLIDAVIAGLDNYYDGTSSAIGGGAEKNLPLYSSTAPIVPQPGNMYIVKDEYIRKGYQSAVPIAVGGTTLGRWGFDTGLFAGDTAATGRDISKIDSPVVNAYVDYEVDNNAADGNSHLLTWIPGHVHMLYWLDYGMGSPLVRNTGQITKTTVVLDLPFVGRQEFDYIVYDPDCDEEVSVTIRRFSNPWILPTGFFGTKPCGGEESLLSWNLTCADTTCANIQRPGNIIT